MKGMGDAYIAKASSHFTLKLRVPSSSGHCELEKQQSSGYAA